jgi:RuvB-like protein 1 (pontin 52)
MILHCLCLSAASSHQCQVEGIDIDEESLAYLGEIGERTSLRHAVQLLTPSFMLAKTNGREGISKGDLEEADQLFHDAKYSAKLLHEQADKFIT